MTLPKYERGNCVKTSIDFEMNGNLTDPSGQTAFFHVIKPDGTYLVSGQEADRDDTGEYSGYFETTSSSPLGIYVIQWYGYHSLGGSWGYKRLVQRDDIQIVSTE